MSKAGCCGTSRARCRRRSTARSRPVIRVDQLRGGDADDTAVPSGPADDEDVAGADSRIVFDRLLASRRAPPPPAAGGGFRRSTAVPGHALRRRALRPSRAAGAWRCPACHAAGGIDARSEMNATCSCRWSCRSGRPRAVRAGRRVRSRQRCEAEPRDDAVLADERHDVGERADRGDLHERWQPVPLSGAPHSAWTSLRATPTPARFLSGYAQSCRFGLMTASAGGSSRRARDDR